jgi:hypothetical protein
VLVQHETASWRSTLANIPPFSAGQSGGHRPIEWRLVEQAAAETGRPVPLSDSLGSEAGAARRPALFPQIFPIPDPVRHLVRQRESELMRKHTHLPAMVGFVRKGDLGLLRPAPDEARDLIPRIAQESDPGQSSPSFS